MKICEPSASQRTRAEFLHYAERRKAGEAPIQQPNCGIRYADKGYVATENLIRLI